MRFATLQFRASLRLFIALSIFASATQSRATVLTFDDISTASIDTVPNGYGGFNWSQMGYLNGPINSPGSGYEYGVVSGEYVAFNEFENVATVTDGTFDFIGAYLTGAWNDGLSVEVEGYYLGSLLYSQTVVTTAYSPTWFSFNYTGVDELRFSSFGGVDQGFGGGGTHFAMDNFTFVVPEASPMVLLIGAGVVIGVFGLRHRIRRFVVA